MSDLDYSAPSAASSSATVDPFASSVASLLGLSFPLSLEAQSLLLSLLGVYVLFTILLAVLLVLYGMGACFEGSTLCCFPQSGGTGFTVLDEKTDMEAAAFQALAKAELVDGTPRIGMLPPPEETVLPLRQSTVSAAADPAAQPQTPSSPNLPTTARSDAVVAFAPAASPGRSPPHQPGLLPGGGYFEAAPTARSLLNGKSLPMPKSTPTSAADADYTGNTTVTTRFADAANSVPSALPPYNAMHSDTYHEMAKAEARAAARFGASGCGSNYYTPTPPRLLVPAPSASCGSARSGASTGRRTGRSSREDAGGGDRTARRIASGFDQLSSRSRSGEAYVGRDSGWRDKESPSWYGV